MKKKLPAINLKDVEKDPPTLFPFPTKKARSSLKVGDYAQIGVVFAEIRAEFLWVKISRVEKGPVYTGNIDNDPIYCGLKDGDEVTFKPKHIRRTELPEYDGGPPVRLAKS